MSNFCNDDGAGQVCVNADPARCPTLQVATQTVCCLSCSTEDDADARDFPPYAVDNAIGFMFASLTLGSEDGEDSMIPNNHAKLLEVATALNASSDVRLVVEGHVGVSAPERGRGANGLEPGFLACAGLEDEVACINVKCESRKPC